MESLPPGNSRFGCGPCGSGFGACLKARPQSGSCAAEAGSRCARRRAGGSSDFRCAVPLSDHEQHRPVRNALLSERHAKLPCLLASNDHVFGRTTKPALHEMVLKAIRHGQPASAADDQVAADLVEPGGRFVRRSALIDLARKPGISLLNRRGRAAFGCIGGLPPRLASTG